MPSYAWPSRQKLCRRGNMEILIAVLNALANGIRDVLGDTVALILGILVVGLCSSRGVQIRDEPPLGNDSPKTLSIATALPRHHHLAPTPLSRLRAPCFAKAPTSRRPCPSAGLDKSCSRTRHHLDRVGGLAFAAAEFLGAPFMVIIPMVLFPCI